MARLASHRLGWVVGDQRRRWHRLRAANHEYDLGDYLDQIAAGAFEVGRRPGS